MFALLPPSFATPNATSILLALLVAFYAILAVLIAAVWAVRRSRSQRQQRAVDRSIAIKRRAAEENFRRELHSRIDRLGNEVRSLRSEVQCGRDATIETAAEGSRLSSELLGVVHRLATIEAEVRNLSVIDDEHSGAEILGTIQCDSSMSLCSDRGLIFHEAPSRIDDLTEIWGIGPHYQKQLHGFGIYQLDQIAQWDDAVVSHFETLFAFKGRIDREQWVAQAKRLIEPDSDRIAA